MFLMKPTWTSTWAKNGKVNILEQVWDIWQRNYRKLKQNILPGDKNYQNT